MKSGAETGTLGGVNGDYELPSQSSYAHQYCDAPNCWRESAAKVDNKRLCRQCRKMYWGVSS